jgi:bacillolysin
MSTRNRVTPASRAVFLSLAILVAWPPVDGAEPDELEDPGEAVIPAAELEIRTGPLGAPRQLKRNPPAVPEGVKPSRGILQTARPPAAGRRAADVRSDTVRAFLKNYRHHLRLDEPVAELKLDRSFTDELNRTHFRYAQQYQGVPVWPSGLNVHLDPSGHVDLMNGSSVPTPHEVDTHPTIDVDRALTRARAQVPGGNQMRVGVQELIIYVPTQRVVPRLAWKFRLDKDADVRWAVLIDAHDNSVLSRYNEVETISAVSGSGIDLFGQRRPLNVVQGDDGRVYLFDTSKPMFNPAIPDGYIGIYDAAHRTTGSAPLVSSAQRDSGWLPDGVSAAFNLSKTYDYYRARHGRNSIDGRGGKIVAFVRYGVKWNNAAWVSSDGALYFGDAQRFAGVLDIVAHEATHGVSYHAAGFIYQDQPGALTEAFSDVLAENVESYVTGTMDWQNGAGLGKPVRSLRNPSALIFLPDHPYPSKMSEYVSGAILDRLPNRDNGGVHINSTIVSHAYYLLAAGLQGAVGVQQAEKIFYRALTVHLSPNSQFLDARLACIQAAEELFGAQSAQLRQVSAAFDAVEIFDESQLLFERSSWKRVLAP